MIDDIRTGVVFDLDGTLYDFVHPLADRLTAAGFHCADPGVWPTYSIMNFAGPEGNDAIEDALNDARFYFNLKPYPGTVEALQRLHAVGSYRLLAISSRPGHVLSTSANALYRDFGEMFVDDTTRSVRVHHCRSKYKARRARDERARVAFEDHGPTAEAYHRAGLRTYLVTRPWNSITVQSPSLVTGLTLAQAVDQLLEPVEV